MASFDGGEPTKMVGDLRPTVGMTNLRFRQNREKQGPFEAPGNAARRQPDSSKDAVTRKQMFQPDSAGRDTFPRRCLDRLSRPAPMGSCNGRPSMIGPVEKQPTVAYSHIG
jgi:hypothetical protein